MIKTIFSSVLFASLLIGCSSSTPEASTTEAAPATSTAAAEGTTATTVAMEKCTACNKEFKKEDMEGAECKKCHEAHGH